MTGPPGFRQRPAWLTAPVLAPTGLAVAAGMAAFSVTVVIGDVAATFGEPGAGEEALAQIGLPVTTLGIALAAIRLASMASLPLAALADRLGRRRMLVTVAVVGLALTSMAAGAPAFWWYVALIAMARPALSALNAIAGVVAAEESRARERAASVALIAVGYGLGSGIVAVGRGLLPGDPSFRLVTAFVLGPLILLPFLVRHLHEPTIAVRRSVAAAGLPGAVPRRLRGRVAVLSLLVGAIAIATGPGFTYLFVYGEGVLGATALEVSTLVLAAGPVGLTGILVGRWSADRLGRRLTAGIAMAGTGLAVALAYAEGFPALAVGYLGTIAFSSAFAPAQGTLAAELVPTAVRATVAGWLAVSGTLGAVLGLMSFGVLADLTGGFDAAARLLGMLTAVCAMGFIALPETRGVELEDLERDEPAG